MALTSRATKLQKAWEQLVEKITRWFGEVGRSAAVQYRAGLRALHYYDHHSDTMTRMPAEWVARSQAAYYVWEQSVKADSANKERDCRRAVIEDLNEKSIQDLVEQYTIHGEDLAAMERVVAAWRFLNKQTHWNNEE
jgi:hypothetical protein